MKEVGIQSVRTFHLCETPIVLLRCLHLINGNLGSNSVHILSVQF